MASPALSAVMYVRMSTESQDYSTDHQRAAIRQYSETHSIPVIREYVDEGKSGLDIRRRAGLLELMRDVQSPAPGFTHIFVYDISRWGRFQDIDEAAYHEHTCRRAGIQVVYCAERFRDDGGPYGFLLKSMKRVMAAEYSRDLSDKVFAAQSRFIEMGYKQGGHAGYGLRRLAIKASGEARAVLEYGESKISATDRVILVRGPENEVAVVQRIYAMYLDEGISEAGLARLLNQEGVPSEFSRPWTQAMVNSVLTNVKYCGTLAYNRRSSKLSSLRVRNEQGLWVTKPGALEALIPADQFARTQAERARRQRRYTPAELIPMLRACHERHGRINAQIIAADKAMPDPQLFVRAFGSLIRAYEAANLPRLLSYAFLETKTQLTALRAKMREDVYRLAGAAGATVEAAADPRHLLIGGLTVRLAVESPRSPRRGARSWRVCSTPSVDFTIAGRFESTAGGIVDYFLLSAGTLANGPIYIKASNIEQFKSIRFIHLNDVFGVPAI